MYGIYIQICAPKDPGVLISFSKKIFRSITYAQHAFPRATSLNNNT